MAIASFTIDQTGLAMGTANRSRSDGLSNGATVTLTSNNIATNHLFELLAVAPGDTTAVASLAPTGDPTIWTFTPTAGINGSYRIRLTVDDGVGIGQDEMIRTFGIRTPKAGLRIPAHNERASESDNLADGGDPENSETNEGNNFEGWHPALQELFEMVERVSATTSEINLYVDDVNGDDNNPGTAALPLADLPAAEALLPSIVNHTVRIFMEPHSGSGYTYTPFKERTINAGVWIYGTGFTEIIGSTPAGAGSSASSVVSSGLNTTPFGGFGEHFGRTIVIDSGNAANDRRTIHHNTTTEYVPNRPFTAAVDPGDTYRIVEPATVIYITTPKDALVANCGATKHETYLEAENKKVNFVNIKFDSASSITLDICRSVVGFFGVEISENCKIVGEGSLLFSGIETFNTVDSPVSDLSLGSNTEWAGWGLSSRNTSYGIIISAINFWGSINANYVSFSNYNQVFILAGSCWGNYALGSSVFSDVYVFGIDFPIWFGNPSITNAILANYHSFMELYGYGNGSLIIKAQHGIRSRNNAQTFITTGVVNGINIEASVGGITTEQLGYISFPVLGEMPTMNCGGNDFSVNAGETYHPISELDANAEFFSLGNGCIERN